MLVTLKVGRAVVAAENASADSWGFVFITVLPKAVGAVRDTVPFIFDSGTRRGMDVAKLLALGLSGLMEYFH